MNRKKLRLGTVGTGKIVHQLADAVRRTDGVEISLVYSRGEASGRTFADAEGIAAVETDLAAFLASPETDAVYIASPNALHFEQAMAALRAGKHVLLEKPATVTLAEYEDLAAEASSRGLVLLEAMRPLHDPMLGAIREALPRLGRLRRVDLEYCQYSSRYDRFKAGELPNAFNPALANAALMDIGVYPIALLVALFGLPSSFLSHSLFIRGGFEAAGDILCEYDGMRAAVSYSKITDSAAPSVITGEAGSLLIDGVSATRGLTLHLRGEVPIALPYIPLENNMVYELCDFRDQILGKPPREPFSEYTHRTVKMLCEVRERNGVVLPCRAT